MTDVQPLEGSRLVRSRAERNPESTSEGNASRDWTIKKLPSETIEVSREAARQHGMKINAWVSRALHEAASTPIRSDLDSGGEISSKVARLEKSIFDEIAQLKAQNADLAETVNSMSAILLKMYTSTKKSK
jgi:hypothetical protein